MEIRPTEPLDFVRIDEHEWQVGCMAGLSYDVAKTMCNRYAYTAEEDGEVVGIAGIITMWEGRGYAWALLSVNSGKKMVTICRAMKAVMNIYPGARIECMVDAEFEAGRKLMDVLGFEFEGRMKKATRDGGDAFLYAYVKDGS